MRKWIFFVSRRIFYVILFREKGSIYCFDPAQQPFTRTFKYLFFTSWESDDVKHAKKCIMPYFILFHFKLSFVAFVLGHVWVSRFRYANTNPQRCTYFIKRPRGTLMWWTKQISYNLFIALKTMFLS